LGDATAEVEKLEVQMKSAQLGIAIGAVIMIINFSGYLFNRVVINLLIKIFFESLLRFAEFHRRSVWKNGWYVSKLKACHDFEGKVE
jgi:hypothetical protein